MNSIILLKKMIKNNRVKITYGKIGKQALVMIINSKPKVFFYLDILLITSDSFDSKRRLNGFVKDLKC